MYLTSIRWDTDSSQMQLTSLRCVQKSILAPIRSVHYQYTGTAQKSLLAPIRSVRYKYTGTEQKSLLSPIRSVRLQV